MHPTRCASGPRNFNIWASKPSATRKYARGYSARDRPNTRRAQLLKYKSQRTEAGLSGPYAVAARHPLSARRTRRRSLFGERRV